MFAFCFIDDVHFWSRCKPDESLGAIDFGIIIDGAVIIVEFIAFQITQKTEEINAFAKAEQQAIER